MDSNAGLPPSLPVNSALGDAMTAESVAWNYMLSGHAEPPARTLASTDMARVAVLVTSLHEERVFITTDVQSGVLASTDPFTMDFGPHTAGPSAPNLGDVGSSSLPGDTSFRFGQFMGSTFSFPNVGPSLPRPLASGPTLQIPPSAVNPSLAPPPTQPAAPPSSANLSVDPAPLPSTSSRGFMSTPAPSRPSSPPLRGPILGLASDILKLNHAVRHSTSNHIPNTNTPASASEDWIPPAQPTNIDPLVSDLLVERHLHSLERTINKALLTGVAGTYNDAEAASEFIIRHPDAELQVPLDEMFNDMWWDSTFSNNDGAALRDFTEVQSEISRKIGSMVYRDSRIVSNVHEGKERIGDFLSEVFEYTFNVLLVKKDASLLGIKQEGSPALAYDWINEIASSMFHAHMGVFVKYEDKPLPVTIHTHPAVADFIQDTTLSNYKRGTTMLHRHKAHNRLIDARAKALGSGRPWLPNPTQELLISKPPHCRFGALTQHLLRVIMPGRLEELYFLNFQAPFLLYVIRSVLVVLHRRTSRDGHKSVVLRYFLQQKGIPPRSAFDSIWRLIILPLAMCVAALYVARENIEAFMDGSIDALTAMASTPKVALVFQAKILGVEKVVSDWRTSPQSQVEYPLLHHRLIEILADVVRPGDDYIGYDLVGPIFPASEPDHFAYGESFTSRDHTLRRFSEPLITRAPSILESSYLASSRSRAAVVSLLKETLI